MHPAHVPGSYRRLHRAPTKAAAVDARDPHVSRSCAEEAAAVEEGSAIDAAAGAEAEAEAAHASTAATVIGAAAAGGDFHHPDPDTTATAVGNPGRRWPA